MLKLKKLWELCRQDARKYQTWEQFPFQKSTWKDKRDKDKCFNRPKKDKRVNVVWRSSSRRRFMSGGSQTNKTNMTDIGKDWQLLGKRRRRMFFIFIILYFPLVSIKMWDARLFSVTFHSFEIYFSDLARSAFKTW